MVTMETESTALLDGRRHYSAKHGSKRRILLWNITWGLLGTVIGMVLMSLWSSSSPLLTADNNNEDDPSKSPPKSSSSSKKRRYTYVQGFGFQIYTGGAPAFLSSNRTKNPECIGRASYGKEAEEGEIQCYIGHDDPIQDVKRRLEIMKTAVERAHELADHSNKTLKVFIAPEFYWRGINGAYLFEQDEEPNASCGAICHILAGLEQLTAQARFDDWLFVFGTIIASEVLPQEDAYDYLFYNFAPIYKGGQHDPSSKTTKTGKRFLLPKRYVSSSDFLTPQRHLNDTLAKELLMDGSETPNLQRYYDDDTTVFNPFDFNQKRYDNDMWQIYTQELQDLGYAMIEYDWLVVNDVTFTIEICFDHDRRSALNTYLANVGTGSTTMIPSITDDGLKDVKIPPYQAQVSIVSSAGMTVTPDALALTHKGIIFLQDGLSNDTARMFWDADTCQKGLEFEGGTEAVTRTAVLTPTDVFFEHKVIETYHKYPVYNKDDSWEESIRGSFSTKVYPPVMTVYDPMEIAKVTKE